MEPKLRQYVEGLFMSAPSNAQTQELKEEIIRNTIERYHDLIADGRTQEAAYAQAVADVGDINELLDALGSNRIVENTYTNEQLEADNNRNTIYKSIAVALYICCVVPVILLGGTFLDQFSPCLMFFMISIATGLLIYRGRTKHIALDTDVAYAYKLKKSAIIKAIAVGLYISCVTPCIMFENNISVVFMFLIIAAATAMIIISHGTKPSVYAAQTKMYDKIQKTKIKKSRGAVYKLLVALIWVTASVTFITITALAGPFVASEASLLFLIALTVQNLMRAIFDYVEASK